MIARRAGRNVLLMGIRQRFETKNGTHHESFYNGSIWITIIISFGYLLIPVTVLAIDANRVTVSAVRIFHSPHPDVLDGFGMSIAGNQHMVLVGAPNEIHNGYEAGKAYLIDRKTGFPIHALGLPSPTGGAFFGQAVLLNGQIAVIGAPHSRDGEGTYTGGVYFFDQKTGKHLRTITNPKPVTGAFGHAIRMRGKQLIVGDPQASTATTYYTGAAYVFDVTTGERMRTLHPLDPKEGKSGWFGHAVDFSESMIVIGAPHEQVEAVTEGVVYGFNAKNADFVRTYRSPTPAESFFGWSLAIDGNLLLIGAFGHEGSHREEGIAYLFDVHSGKVIRTLHNPDPLDRAHFGKSVAISEKYLFVGSPGDRVKETGMNRGAVYVFDRKSGKVLEKVVNPGNITGADDLFGDAIAIASGDERLLVGAPFGGIEEELDAGLVYEFDITNGRRSEFPPDRSSSSSNTP